MSEEKSKQLCELCGNPMPDGEEMFRYHGYSGACPPKAQVIHCDTSEDAVMKRMGS